MEFFTTAVSSLSTVVTAIGTGVGVWGIINLMEGYGEITQPQMLMCHKVTHKNLMNSKFPLFRKIVKKTGTNGKSH